MNSHGVLSSIFWKDYRELRAFWLVTALFGIGLQAAVAFVATRMNLSEFFRIPILAWAVLVPAMYALGCAAVIFAGEHESGTASLLRSLPVEPRRLLLGHVVFALASTLVMLGVTCAAFLVLRRVMPIETGSLALTAGQLGILPAELFVWGLLFSLLLRRAIFVAMLGGLFGALLPFVCAVIHANLYHVPGTGAIWWAQVLPIRAALVLLVAAVDVWLVRRWFHDAGVLGRRKIARRESLSGLHASVGLSRDPALAKSEYEIGEFTWQNQARPVSRRGAFPVSLELSRLIWQQWRQSRWLLLAFMPFLVLLVVTGFLLQELCGDFIGEMWSGVVLLPIPLAAACVFREDWQDNRFRFLADHGARPGQVWLSRQLVWLVPVILGPMVFGIILLLIVEREPRGDFGSLVASMLLYMGTAFACGQFCSMYLRSSILSGLFTLILLSVLCAWGAFLVALFPGFLLVHLLWAFVPMPAMLLAATRLRTGDWMLQRTGWRARARAVLVPLTPVLVILTVLPFYRVYSVPGGGPGFSVEEFHRPRTAEQRATAALYQEAWESLWWPKDDEGKILPDVLNKVMHPPSDNPFLLLPLDPVEATWVEKNAKAIEKAILASRREECSFLLDNVPPVIYVDVHNVQRLGSLLVASARKHAFEGDLDLALEHYEGALGVVAHLRTGDRGPWAGERLEESVQTSLLAWAAHPDQTGERIKRMLDAVKRLSVDDSACANSVKESWRWEQRHALEGQWRLDRFAGRNWCKSVQFLAAYWFPWERARARRVVDYSARTALAELRRVEAALKNNQRVEPAAIDRRAAEFHQSTDTWSNSPEDNQQRITELVRREMRRRAFVLQLALAAWRREHDSLPKTLDELVGTYLDAVPVDPHTGKSFLYFPEGVPKSMFEYVEPCWGDSDSSRTARLSAPFIWSRGNRLDHALRQTVPTALLREIPEASRCEDFGLYQGRVFPIP
ncbi:MAG: ABC transporter permease [Pirellulaceae bacterium]|nr:ABC transporter permease [Pirellulaceae bacterium]